MYDFFNSNKLKVVSLFFLIIIHSFLMVTISLFIGFILEYADKGSILGVEFNINYIITFLSVYVFTILIIHLICFNMINMLVLRQKYFLEQKLLDTFSSRIYHSSEILNLFSSDINLVCEKYYKNWFQLLKNLFFIVCTFILTYFFSLYVFILTLGLFAISVALQLLFIKKISKSREEYRLSKIDFNKNILSYISSSFSINFFNGKEYIMKKSKESINMKSKVEYKLNNYINISNYLITLVPTASSIFAAIVCTYLVTIEKLSYSNAVAILFIIGFLMWELVKLLNYKNQIDSTKPIRDNLFNILNSDDSEIVDDVMLLNDKIKFNNISVKYNEKLALKNISLEFEFGKSYLILGESGSGKSTLIKLLLKGIEEYSGELLFGGVDVKKIDKKQLYKDIGYIIQNGEFIPDTLGRNVSLSLEYDSKRVRQSLELAKYNNFADVDLERIIDLEAANFSGGELQRVALARLFYHRKSICILDEFTSALHNEMARELEQQILSHADDTVIIVSHRAFKEVVELYDRVIILSNGEIIFNGNYEESNNLIKLYTV
ncbi:MAG: ATP-binding cassette domain-containing protein [Alkaliphilus sp.]